MKPKFYVFCLLYALFWICLSNVFSGTSNVTVNFINIDAYDQSDISVDSSTNLEIPPNSRDNLQVIDDVFNYLELVNVVLAIVLVIVQLRNELEKRNSSRKR